MEDEGGFLSPEVARAALAALLDRVRLPAAVVQKDGSVAGANEAAQRRLAEVAPGGRDDRRGSDPRLAVLRLEEAEAHRRVERYARQWGLTAREHLVLGSVVNGLSNKEIAAYSNRCVRTIELAVSAIMRKARARSRYVLIATVLRG